jgi:hypothetical protein
MDKSKREENLDVALTQQVNEENKNSKEGVLKTSTPYSEDKWAGEGNSVKFKTIIKVIVGLFVALFLVVLVIAAVRYFIG